MTDLLRELEAVVLLADRLDQLSDAVAAQRWNEFSMRVPAEPHRDADLVLASIARFLRTHHAEIAEALKDARTEREIQNAADKLPDGYNITIYVEKGSGYIDLTDPDGDPVHVDTDDRNMAQQIAEATRIAAIDAHNSAREVGE